MSSTTNQFLEAKLPTYAIIAAGVILVASLVYYQLKQKINKNDKEITKQKQQKPQTIGQTKKIEKQKPKIEINQVKCKIKSQKQLQTLYQDEYFGCIGLRQNKSIHYITAICFKQFRILMTTTKNDLILYDLRKWQKERDTPQRYFTSLENNNATAVTIGNKYYYVALGFDKTIVYYEFYGEDGIYFKQVKRFLKNTLDSDAAHLWASKNQQYILSAGSGTDTIIQIWSMAGQKLFQINTYQIQHYSIMTANNLILVRGWTSEVKLFQTLESKTGSFNKLQKLIHLTHQQSPALSSLDDTGLYALTVSKAGIIFLWNLRNQNNRLIKSKECRQLYLKNIKLCNIFTIKYQNQRLKTAVVLSDGNKILICNKDIQIRGKIQEIDCQQIHLMSYNRQLIMCTVNSQGKALIWKLQNYLDKMNQYQLDLK